MQNRHDPTQIRGLEQDVASQGEDRSRFACYDVHRKPKLKDAMRFAIATLMPIPLLALAAVFGGVWVVAALIYMTGLVFGLDTLIDPEDAAEFPAADALSVTLALLHFPLLAIVVWGLSRGDVAIIGKIGLFVASGMYFGQVGNSNAHELIHRSTRSLHRLGMWVYISLLFGHHTSAHVLVHHRHVATDADPSSAKLGESYYRFVLRAWIGSFRKGLDAERARLAKIGRSKWRNPYLIYGAGSALMILTATLIGGFGGMVAYVLLAFYATSQLLLSDYVQHYGLRRAVQGGKPEPVGERHSWNAPQWFSSALMLNAPRHSDHHAHPSRAFPDLRLSDDAPTLPRSLPAMATLALFPTLWRRVMDHRARKWTHA